MKVPDNTLLIYFPAEHVNGMLAVFDLFIRANQKNETAIAAAKLKQKILAHGRVFQFQESETVSIMFFESELRSLIQILTLYAFVMQENCQKYLPKIGRKKKARSGQTRSVSYE